MIDKLFGNKSKLIGKQCKGVDCIYKPYSEFHKSKSSKDGFMSFCKDCWKEMAARGAKKGGETTRQRRSEAINNPNISKSANEKKTIKNSLDVAEEQDKQLTYEEKRKRFNDWIGKTSDDLEVRKVDRKANGKRRYLILSDLHFPYVNKTALKKIMDKEADRCDKGYIAGDLFDMESLSSHRKFKSLSVQEEMAENRLMCEWLNSYGLPFEFVDGNHDRGRWQRNLDQNVPKELHFLVADPFKMVVDGLNITSVGMKFSTEDKDINVGWFTQIGKDAFIGHCEKGGNTPLRNVSEFEKWLDEWKKPLGLPEARWIASGHCHRLGTQFKHDRQLVDPGSLMSLTGGEYAVHDTKVMFRPSVLGYAILVQDEDGNTLLDDCEVNYVEV